MIVRVYRISVEVVKVVRYWVAASNEDILTSLPKVGYSLLKIAARRPAPRCSLSRIYNLGTGEAYDFNIEVKMMNEELGHEYRAGIRRKFYPG